MKGIIVLLALLVVCASAASSASRWKQVSEILSPQLSLAKNHARASASQCAPIQCVKLTQACNSTQPCGAGTCVNKVCVATIPVGGNCSTTDGTPDCVGECNGMNCVLDYEPGTPCTTKYQCGYWPADGNACVNKKCVGLTQGQSCTGSNSNGCTPPLTCQTNGLNMTCQSLQPIGGKCGHGTDCQKSLVCVGATCQARLAAGASCSLLADYKCPIDSFCTPTDATSFLGKCIQAFTQAAGAFCIADYHCGEGLACPSASFVATCTKVASSSLKACDLNSATPNSTCSPNEECKCSYKNGKGICLSTNPGGNNPKGIKNLYLDVANCVNDCNADEVCVASKCKKNYCSYETEGTGYIHQIYPDCFINAVSALGTSYLKCSAGTHTEFSVVLILLLALVSLMF